MEDNGNVNHPVDVVLQAAGHGAGAGGAVHEVNADEFQNMRLSIGTLGRMMLDISLSENLDDTRSIDVVLRRDNAPPQAAAPEHEPAPIVVDPAPDNRAPAGQGGVCGDAGAGTRRGGGRLRITVAAEGGGDGDDDKKYLDKMQGWLMTVATIFISTAFQAMLQPPDWLLTRSRDTYAVAPAPAGSADDRQRATTAAGASGPEYKNVRQLLYLVSNMFVFSTALTVTLLLLVKPPSARRTIKMVRLMMFTVSLFLALAFVLCTSESWKVLVGVCVSMAMYAAGAVVEAVSGRPHLILLLQLIKRLVRRR